MTSQQNVTLDGLLARVGRTNFSLDCTVDGAPARLAMTEREVVLAVAGDPPSLTTSSFVDAISDGSGLARRVQLGSMTAQIHFDSEHASQRFDRVLQVRIEDSTRRPASVRGWAQTTASAPSTVARPQATGFGLTSAEKYRRWMDYALWASAWLIAAAWVEAVGGILLTGYSMFTGLGPAALLWLLATGAGCAIPLCLGSFVRMVAFRFRAEDEAANAR